MQQEYKENIMNDAKTLGSREQFPLRRKLVQIPIETSVPSGVWRLGGPDYSAVMSMGVEPTDRIVCELGVGASRNELWDCGTLSDYFSTQTNMVSVRGRYLSGNAISIHWWRLPETKTFAEMTDAEVKAAIREITRTAKSEEEVRNRLKDELQYHNGAAVTSTSSGRLIMFMVMVHGHDGVIHV
jgi:hypothetical protein